MSPAADDWRRGNEQVLAGLTFTWKTYQAYSGYWEHEHCTFCRKKFLDGTIPTGCERLLRLHPASTLQRDTRTSAMAPRRQAGTGCAASASRTSCRSSVGKSSNRTPTPGPTTRRNRLRGRRRLTSTVNARARDPDDRVEAEAAATVCEPVASCRLRTQIHAGGTRHGNASFATCAA